MRKSSSNSSSLLMFVVAVVSLIVGATLASLFGGKSVASSTGGNVEEAVQKVLENNPQLIVDAFQKGRLKQQQAQQQVAGKNIAENLDKLEKNDKAPFIGNAKADVVIVEFFDYSCGYCKRVINDVAKIVEDDKNVKFVFKELPILGPGSEIAARAALAVYVTQPDKYFAIHRALMEFQGQKSEESVMDLVKKLGLNVANIKEEMKSSKVSELLKANRELAQSIGVNGTPAFIIGGNLTPGAMDINAMKAAIENARKK